MPNENKANENVDEVQENEASSKTEAQTSTEETETLSLEDAMARIAKLEGINKEVIGDRDKAKNKLREIEQADSEREEARLNEQGEYKALLEKEKERTAKLESGIRDREVDSLLSAQLRESGLADEAIKTALALVNKADISYDLDNGVDTKSIDDSINALKENHSVLFSTKPKTPDVKRAADRSEPETYLSELQKLRNGGTRRELEALRAKYNR